MTDEEKKAIEVLKSKRASEQLMISGKMCVDILLNLIEKQSKEIEELKEENKKLDKENQGLFVLYNFNDSTLLTKILKDYKKIIEKQQKEIEELKKYEKYYEEMEEVNKKFLPVDKIKAKIEEIEKRRLQDGECELALHEFQREAKLEVLQSLLKDGGE